MEPNPLSPETLELCNQALRSLASQINARNAPPGKVRSVQLYMHDIRDEKKRIIGKHVYAVANVTSKYCGDAQKKHEVEEF